MQPARVITLDTNSDKIPDFAVSSGINNKIDIFTGGGSNGVADATFTRQGTVDLGISAYEMAAADINDDGITDIVVAPFSKDKISVLHGNGTNGVGNSGFTIDHQFNSECQETNIILHDFNEDGHLDLVCGEHGTEKIYVYLGQTTGGVSNGTFAAIPNTSQ